MGFVQKHYDNKKYKRKYKKLIYLKTNYRKNKVK